MNLAGFSRSVYTFIGNYIKAKIEKKGKGKIKFIGYPVSRKIPQMTNVEVIKRNLIEKSVECVIAIGDEYLYLAITEKLHNPFEFQKRDVKRPMQRAIFGISPRLAKILVNLSHLTNGQRMLDPFCGYGTVLQEALLMGIHVTGVDKNPKCPVAALKNLKWISEQYKTGSSYKVYEGDATQLHRIFQFQSFDAIVTEPYLGPVLKTRPSNDEARKIIRELTNLYTNFLLSARAVLKNGGRLVMTTPIIIDNKKGKVSINMRLLSKNGGLKIENPIVAEKFSMESQRFLRITKLKHLEDFNQEDKIRRQITVFVKR